MDYQVNYTPLKKLKGFVTKKLIQKPMEGLMVKPLLLQVRKEISGRYVPREWLRRVQI
jgi:hypothetical protein